MIELGLLFLLVGCLWIMTLSLLVVGHWWQDAKAEAQKNKEIAWSLLIKHEGWHRIKGVPEPVPPRPAPLQWKPGVNWRFR